MCARLHACGFYAVFPFPPAPPSFLPAGARLQMQRIPPSSSSSAAPKVLKRTRRLFLQTKQAKQKSYFFFKKGRFHPAFSGWLVCFFLKKKNSFATYLCSFPEWNNKIKTKRKWAPPASSLVLRPYLTARAAPCKAADLSFFSSLKQPQ